MYNLKLEKLYPDAIFQPELYKFAKYCDHNNIACWFGDPELRTMKCGIGIIIPTTIVLFDKTTEFTVYKEFDAFLRNLLDSKSYDSITLITWGVPGIEDIIDRSEPAWVF